MRHLIAAAGLALLAGATSANAQSYSIANDFGSSVFQYGQGQATVGLTSFTAFAATQGGSSGCNTGFTCYLGSGGFPFIQKNNSAASTNPQYPVAIGAVDAHPADGAGNTDAIILFTAQTAGTYDITGSFRRDNNTAEGNGVIGSIFSQVTGGLPSFLFQATLLPSTGNPSQAFSVVATLVAGQTIGFAINNNGEYTYDSTGLAATIANRAVPGPIAGAGLVSLLGLAGVMVARRRREKLAA